MKLDENDEEEGPKFKIKKEIPSTSSLEYEFSPVSDPEVSPSPIKEEKEDLWETLENAGQIKDLLPSGMIKNSSKLRFDVKEISLTEDV